MRRIHGTAALPASQLLAKSKGSVRDRAWDASRTPGRNGIMLFMNSLPKENLKMSTDDQNRIPLPQEAADNYTLDLREEFATDAVIPATVGEIIDDDDTLRVTATFAGHPELAET